VSVAAEGYRTRPFLKVRRAYVDMLDASRRKHVIHGLIEADVTAAREILRDARNAGTDLSFTAFVMHAIAQAVAEDPVMHAYRRGRQLVMFDDVDVNTQVETSLSGQLVVASVLVRSANRKSISELTTEIRHVQHDSDPAAERRLHNTLAFLRLPRPVRRLGWRAVLANPVWFKRLGGTVGLTSVGMFGPNGGWGLPIAPPTLMVTVGGIATRPRYVEGVLSPRELVDLTISVDHDIVDGAPAARFARRLTTLLEQADGLLDPG
jgi:pyruvate/2-oxoglutarate dehydrogenase complex dihydrolipoamide acyltransferase (E2) component